jgi:hypothetical protein
MKNNHDYVNHCYFKLSSWPRPRRLAPLREDGDGEEFEALKAQIARLGFTGAVRFIGHVKARYGFSKGQGAGCSLARGFPALCVIEAAAAGVPMMAANLGGIPEYSASIPRRCSRRTSWARWPTPSKPRSTIPKRH